MSPQRVYGIVSLGGGVLCTDDCLGRKLRVEVGGCPGWLFLPEAPAVSHGNLLPPRKYLGFLQEITEALGKDRGWGWTYTPDEGHHLVGSAVIELVPESQAVKRHGDNWEQRLDYVADRWVRLLLRHIGGSGEQLVTAPYGIDLNPQVTLWRSTDEGGVTRFPSQLDHRSIRFRGSDTPLSLDSFRKLIKHANTGRDLHRARRFLLDARTAVALNEPRRAVVDAATATEIAATEWLQVRIRCTLDEKGVEQTLDKWRTLGARLKLCGIWGLDLSSKLQQELVGLRNQVVHEGREVAEKEASTACDLAEGTLRRFGTRFLDPVDA